MLISGVSSNLQPERPFGNGHFSIATQTQPNSSPSIFQEIQSFYQSRQADLNQLGSALQSGNLSGAQQAYSSLAALGQDSPFANSGPFSNALRAQTFNAIGQDLQAGNLAEAQTAFGSLTAKLGGSTTSTLGAPSSIAAVASSIYQQLQAYREQRASDLNQLGQDLQAGNLTVAQQDFNNLSALGQSGPNKNGQPFQRADREQDFQAIGQALQSGNLAAAQSSFASLSGTFQNQDPVTQAAATAYATLRQDLQLGGAIPSELSSLLTATPVSLGAATGSLRIN
jgi:hypothetical protein